MTAKIEVLEAEIAKLSSADRTYLLERLLAGLDEDREIEAAWDRLADAREAQLGADSGQAVPMDQAFQRLEARFPG